MKPAIFVQIASYRDPELVPTLIDLIAQAESPESLRIVVCWQHVPDETLGIFWRRGFAKWHFKTINSQIVHFMEYGGAKIELIDILHLKTEGPCWARNLVQQYYESRCACPPLKPSSNKSRYSSSDSGVRYSPSSSASTRSQTISAPSCVS